MVETFDTVVDRAGFYGTGIGSKLVQALIQNKARGFRLAVEGGIFGTPVII